MDLLMQGGACTFKKTTFPNSRGRTYAHSIVHTQLCSTAQLHKEMKPAVPVNFQRGCHYLEETMMVDHTILVVQKGEKGVFCM